MRQEESSASPTKVTFADSGGRTVVVETLERQGDGVRKGKSGKSVARPSRAAVAVSGK